MHPENQNPDFGFLDNQPAPSRGPGKKQRIMIASAGAVILIIILMIVGSIILGGGKDTSATSLKLAQLHTELIRVAELGEESARGQEAKNIAVTTKLTLLSSSSDILAIANSNKKVEKKLLNAGQDSKTDKSLTEAEQRSQFDEVFLELLVVEIKEYQKALTNAFDESNSKKNKEIFNNLFLDLKKITDAADLN